MPETAPERTLLSVLYEDAERALTHPRYKTLQLAQGRVMIVKPRVDAREVQTEGGVWKPASAVAREREWAYETIVLRVGRGVPSEIEVGDAVLVAQWAGMPILDLEAGYETLLWIIGWGDIIAQVGEV